MPRTRRVARRNRAATAPHTASHTTSFRHPVHSDITVKTQGFIHFLIFKLAHCPTPATFLTFKLAHCPTPATFLTTTCAPAPHLHQNYIKAILPCFPRNNSAHKIFKEKLCPELDGSRAETAPQPLRTQRLTPLAFATPRTQIYCENTGIHTLPYFQTCTLSHACQIPYFQTHCPTPAAFLTTTCAPAPHLHQHYIAKSNPALLPQKYLRTQNFQRKAMFLYVRVYFQAMFRNF